MTDSPNHPTAPLSACHHAPVKAVGGRGDFSDHEEGITMHYECTAEGCGQMCDLAVEPKYGMQDVVQDDPQPQPAEAGELR